MARYHVGVRYDRPAVLPVVGPRPSQEARDAFAAMGRCGSGDRGDTTFHVTVTADDELHARAEGLRLADQWARCCSIPGDGTVLRVAEALEPVGALA